MTVPEYNRCVDLHADGVYRFVLKHLKDSDAARDVVQDAFEKMWRRLGEIDGAKSKTYLFTTAYHRLIDHVRDAKRRVKMDDNEHDRGHHLSTPDLKAVLNRALDDLPEIQKTVVLLRDYEGYDYSEIGGITGLSESQVKVYIFRARQALREKIGTIEAVL